MQQLKTIIFQVLILLFCTAYPSYAGWLPWGDPTLATIEGQDYSAEDFKNWWTNWQEKDTQFPASPDAFVDWFLLFKEAERMKLYESPAYRKKVLTFLKARTLMLLKAEEIDGKIKISDDELWQQYEETHAPQYQLNILFFKEQETARLFVEKFGSGTVSNEEFSSSHGRDDGYFSQRTEWYRPLAINPGWMPIILELKKGQMSDPVAWKKDFVVLRLEDKLAGTRDDFELMKKQLRQTVWKTRENELTVELLSKLRQQYHVKIDTERLEQLDASIADDTLSDETLIYTDMGNISAKIVLLKIRQIQRFRRQNGFMVKTDLQFKKQIVNGIIDQTLTSWEALARKYEQKTPFAAVYQFYCQHRMIKLLEERLFFPQVKVNEEELKVYYEGNIALFTKPEVIRMAIVEGAADDLNGLWLEVAMGEELALAAQKRTGHDVPIREIPANHLNPKVKEVVEKLSKNEVSQVFTVDDHVSLVQLIERKDAEIIPLSEVKESIRETLRTAKLSKLRQDYLARLRQEYGVEVNNGVWQNIRKELEQQDETN